MQVLLVEDDEVAASSVLEGLKMHGIDAVHAANGRKALEIIAEFKPDVLVLDRMMPEMDGMEMLSKLREQGDNVPVLMLSALGDVEDRVVGLKAGADDYLAKPFSLDELVARLEVLSKRTPNTVSERELCYADLRVDLIDRRAERNGQDLELQPREFSMLVYFLKNQGTIVSRSMLLENVFDLSFDPQTNVIDVHISRLRQKLDKQHASPLLQTVRGSGYILQEQSGN
ncbi:response regulator transcription factor [Alphaproteobacteria bacterium]|nr:response regulator transcription factor [Alphaproteobacteria bacterium]